jgi:hypothetical protein
MKFRAQVTVMESSWFKDFSDWLQYARNTQAIFITQTQIRNKNALARCYQRKKVNVNSLKLWKRLMTLEELDLAHYQYGNTGQMDIESMNT